MTITKLTSTDGFLVVDLPDATTAAGVVRCARKILQDGAVNLARTATYGFAVFGYPISGASAAINAEGDARDGAVSAAMQELSTQCAEGRLVLEAGKGVRPEEVAATGQPAGLADASADLDASATSIVAAATSLLDEVAGAVIVIEDTGALAVELASRLESLGATVTVAATADALVAECAVLILGSKPGLVDHEVASRLKAGYIVPSGPIPVTARGLAVARRSGCEVVADFVSLGGPYLRLGHLLAGEGAGEGAAGETASLDIAARVGDVMAASRAFPDGALLGACFLAEEFLRTWTSDLPFGRPLA